MSNVDDELKQALSDSEAEAETMAEAGVAIPEGTADVDYDDEPDDSKRNLGLVIGLLVAVGAIVAFVLGSPSDNMIYAVSVNDVLGSWEEQGERNLRVQGVLVHGSLKKRDDPCEYRFKMKNKDGDSSGQMDVRYGSCIVPDTFRDVKGMPVEVTAEGQLTDGYLQAKHIFAKCPSKYEMQEKQAAGEDAPHQLPSIPTMPDAKGAGSVAPEDLPSGTEG